MKSHGPHYRPSRLQESKLRLGPLWSESNSGPTTSPGESPGFGFDHPAIVTIPCEWAQLTQRQQHWRTIRREDPKAGGTPKTRPLAETLTPLCKNAWWFFKGVIFQGCDFSRVLFSLMAFRKGGHTTLKQYIYIRALKGWSCCFGRRSWHAI